MQLWNISTVCLTRSFSNIRRLRPDLSLQMLALDRYVAKALPEVVLGAIAPAVSLIAADRQHHVAVLAVVSQDFLETACHIEKLVMLAQLALDE